MNLKIAKCEDCPCCHLYDTPPHYVYECAAPNENNNPTLLCPKNPPPDWCPLRKEALTIELKEEKKQ